MRFTKHMFGVMALSCFLCACSNSDDTTGNTEGDASAALSFRTQLDGRISMTEIKAPRTRAVTFSNYPIGTQLLVGIQSNTPAIDQSINGKRTTTLLVNNTDNEPVVSNPVFYWNDLGSNKADLNVWGLYLAGSKTAVTEFGELDWSISTDQTAGIAPNDLHWSNNVKNITYKKVADMIFKHAMSMITVNLTVGEGFTNEEATQTVFTLVGNLTKTHVNALNEQLSNQNTVAKVKPAIVKDFADGMQATYQAIVVPSREIAVGDSLATIKIGNNLYVMRSKEIRTYESGKNYIYNVSVKKSGITFTTTIADWEEVQGSGDTQIIFTAGAGDGQPNGVGPNALNNETTHFNVYTSKDNNDYDADKNTSGTQHTTSTTWVPAVGVPGTPDYVDGHWKNDLPIYWQDDADDTYFRAFSPTDDEIKSDNNGNLSLEAGDKDFIWGTSGSEAKNPCTGDVTLFFQHIMSKVVINVITTDGDDAVDLTTISKQLLTNIATTGSFNIGTGELAPFTAENYKDYSLDLKEVAGSNQKKYTYEFFSFPQVLKDNTFFNIVVGNAPSTNEFVRQLNTITANGTPVTEWEAGKRYVYNILVKKTEKKFSVILTDWEDVITEEAEAEL